MLTDINQIIGREVETHNTIQEYLDCGNYLFNNTPSFKDLLERRNKYQ